MVKLYGVKTCDSCRKARRWLDAAGVDYQYVDLRDDGTDRTQLQRWIDTHGAARLVNKRSLTWRNLDAGARQACESDPVTGLQTHPTLIKRPILDTGATTLVGFTPADYEAALSGAE